MRAYIVLAFASLAVPIAGVLAQLPLPEVGNLTATAMLGWYAWHTVARTIPELVASFRAELSAERIDHRAAVETICREIAAERDRRHADSVAIIDALQKFNRPTALRE